MSQSDMVPQGDVGVITGDVDQIAHALGGVPKLAIEGAFAVWMQGVHGPSFMVLATATSPVPVGEPVVG